MLLGQISFKFHEQVQKRHFGKLGKSKIYAGKSKDVQKGDFLEKALARIVKLFLF